MHGFRMCNLRLPFFAVYVPHNLAVCIRRMESCSFLGGISQLAEIHFQSCLDLFVCRNMEQALSDHIFDQDRFFIYIVNSLVAF